MEELNGQLELVSGETFKRTRVIDGNNYIEYILIDQQHKPLPPGKRTGDKWTIEYRKHPCIKFFTSINSKNYSRTRGLNLYTAEEAITSMEQQVGKCPNNIKFKLIEEINNLKKENPKLDNYLGKVTFYTAE
jgi:hypothetical protein